MPQDDRMSALVAAVVCHRQRIALVVAGRERWEERDGYTFVPAELPGGACRHPDRPQDDVHTICAAALRGPVSVRSSRRLYGPSERHAIDALPPEGEREPRPLLRLVRLLPIEEGAHAPRVVTVRAYLATAPRDIEPAPPAAALLWLTPRCLRIALRGVPLRDLLAEDGAELRSAASDMLPVDAFLYVPADYGERHLVRIAAKYGTEALFQERAAEVDDGLQS